MKTKKPVLRGVVVAGTLGVLIYRLIMYQILWPLTLVVAAFSAPAVYATPVCYLDMSNGVVDLSHLCGHNGGSVEVRPPSANAPAATPEAAPQRERRYGAFLDQYARSNPSGTYREARIVGDARDYCRGVEDLAGNSFSNDALSWVFDRIDEADNALERERLIDHWFAIHWNAPTTFC